ncbi:centrosomal protein 43-like isoform X2 [Apostichopus japonicus]|uniref:centrosomal protein 43-like isoform X2 n=1 Tax=Stichopus japonicus TaxID=307972 RepID=UPI003AB41A24
MSADEDTELRDLVAQTLETSGVLGKIRAELRASVFLALEEQQHQQKKTSYINQELKTFLQSKDGLTVANLVLEFLNFFNLDFTAAVFNPEANLKGKCEKRAELRKRLNLESSESTEKKPLILELLEKTNQSQGQPKSLGTNLLHLSAAQIQDAKQKFEHYDKDKSGAIDKNELRNLFMDMFPHFHKNMLERYVNDEFSAGDSDFSSGIEFDEFLGMYKRLFILCRGVIAHHAGDMVPVAQRTPAIGSAQSDMKGPKVNGSTNLEKTSSANKNQNQSSLPQSRSRSSSEERDDFFDDPFVGSGTGLRLGRKAPVSSPPRSPSKGGGGLSSLSDAPSLFGPPGSLLGSPPITGKQAKSPDWKDLSEMDSKISRLNFDEPKNKSEEQRTPGDGNGKKSQSQDDGDDYEDDFQSSSPGSPSQEGRSHKSRGESMENSISEEIPEELSADDDFLASSQERMDDLTTDRSLSQFSQGGEIDYMEDVQLTK